MWISVGERLLRGWLSSGFQPGALLRLIVLGSISVSITKADVLPLGRGEREEWSRLHVPPLEGEGLPTYVGATVHLPVQHVVWGEIVNEGTVQTQRLQQRPYLLFQAAAAIDDGSKGLGDAQVLTKH